MSVEALVQCEVLPGNPGSRAPGISDWPAIEKLVSEATDNIKWENYDSATDVLSKILDHSQDSNELEAFQEKQTEAIITMHGVIRDAHNRLSEWDPDIMTRDQMVSFVDELSDIISEGRPKDLTLYQMAHENWFRWPVGNMLRDDSFLRSVVMSPGADDNYHGTISVPGMGLLDVTACGGGVLKFYARFESKWMTFTNDASLVCSNGTGPDMKSRLIAKVVDFAAKFDIWWAPTEDEMEFFDVLQPGMDWTVFRYLREYRNHYAKSPVNYTPLR